MKNSSKNIKKLQAVVRSIHLKTIGGGLAELQQFKPEDSSNFEIDLEIFIGIEINGECSERFDLAVCTPKWILDHLEEGDHMIGHGILIVPTYSYDRIVGHIKSYVKMCVGSTIDDVMRRVGLLGEWESEWEI